MGRIPTLIDAGSMNLDNTAALTKEFLLHILTLPVTICNLCNQGCVPLTSTHTIHSELLDNLTLDLELEFNLKPTHFLHTNSRTTL